MESFKHLLTFWSCLCSDLSWQNEFSQHTRECQNPLQKLTAIMRLEKETKASGNNSGLQSGGHIMDTLLTAEVTCRYPLERSHLPELGEVCFAVVAESLAEVVSFSWWQAFPQYSSIQRHKKILFLEIGLLFGRFDGVLNRVHKIMVISSLIPLLTLC